MTDSAANPWAGWLGRCILLLLPALLYAGGITPRFGLRDDYSTLRESREEPGKVFGLNASHGRPLYGWMLENSFRRLDGIDGLRGPRWWSVAALGAVCASLAWVLERQLGWARIPSLLAPAWLATLPGMQVIAHWAICWPFFVAGWLGLAAFALNEHGTRAPRGGARHAAQLGSGVLLLAALLIYQPTALFFVVPLAAGWLARADEAARPRLAWAARHVAVLAAALLAAFLFSHVLFAAGLATQSARFHLETAWLDKLGWFFRHPLPQALALGVLDDVAGRTQPWFTLAATATVLVLAAGGLLAWHRRGATAALFWWGGCAAFVALAYSVSFVAAERWPSYRTIGALGGVLVVFVTHTLWQFRARGVRALPVGVALASAVLAVHTSRTYLADAQAGELRRLSQAAAAIEPAVHPRVALWLPLPADAPAAVRHLDEFGSLSADAEWCAKEMLQLVLRERFAAQPALAGRVQFSSNYTPPPAGSFDTLLDLRVKHAADAAALNRKSAPSPTPPAR